MTTQPGHTSVLPLEESIDTGIAPAAAILTMTAQQAVLPRALGEGIYAILDADGAVQIVETTGYKQQRKHAWNLAHADRPEFVHRQVTLLDVDSFIDYIAHNTDSESFDEVSGQENAHGSGELELWADIDARTIKAILDGYDGLRKHTATLQLKIAREWAEWASVDGKLLGQVEFAQFIEDHLSTIAKPDGAQLLDICQTLEATKSAQFKQQHILASGQRTFRHEEQIEGKAGVKGDLTIPGELTLVLRPFQGSDLIPITARFRFRPDSEGLRLGVKLAEPDRVLEEAFAMVVADVQDRVPVHVNNGRG